MADYNATKQPNLPFAIFRPLFDAVSKFKDLGVYHGDVSSSNILVSPSEAPVRAFSSILGALECGKMGSRKKIGRASAIFIVTRMG